MVVGFTTTCAISDYLIAPLVSSNSSYEFEPRSWRGVLDTIYANFNIVVYLGLLDANIGTPLVFAPVVKE
jgi:hypothetical protein